MGKYINETINGPIGFSFDDKINALVKTGAEKIQCPTIFIKNLVCVVDNGLFAAAGYCYDEREFNCFCNVNDKRRKQWLTWNDAEKFAK